MGWLLEELVLEGQGTASARLEAPRLERTLPT